jgi:transposase
MKRVIYSDKEELIALLQSAIHEDEKSRILHRMHVVLFMLETDNLSMASQVFHDPIRTIQHWLMKLREGGLQGLYEREKPGRPSRLTPAQEGILRKELLLLPKEVNPSYSQANWDGILLSHHIQRKWHISLQVRQCQRLFHKLGMTLQRPRMVSIGNQEDQEQFKKKRLHF